MMNNNNHNHDEKYQKMAKRLAWNLAVAIILAICLCVTTFALVYTTVTVEGNVFETATFGIKLYNEHKVLEGPIISRDDNKNLFEPGKTVVKTFYIENTGTADAYFRIFFDFTDPEKVDLAKSLEVQITDSKDNVLYEWTEMAHMIRSMTRAAKDEVLEVGETLELHIWFRMPEDVGNVDPDSELVFDMYAEAVQTKNNDEKEFE